MACYIQPMKNGGTMIICGKLGPHCAAEKCAAVSDFLCDYPVGEGKTCDLPLCSSHAYEVAPNVHYCPSHLVLWQEFKNSGGVKAELENVVPFKEQP